MTIAPAKPEPTKTPEAPNDKTPTTPPAPEKTIAEVAPKFLERTGWARPTDPEKPAEEKPAEKKPETPEAPAEKPAKVRKIAKGYENAPSLSKRDLQEVVTAAAGTAAAEAVKAVKAAPAPPPAKPEITLIPEDRRRIEVFTEMARLNPKYADLPANTQRYLEELARTQADHSAKNPGEEFDADGSIQEALKEKHKLNWEDADFAEAEKSLITAPVNSKVEKLEKKIAELEEQNNAQAEQRRIESLRPVVNKASTEAQVTAAELLGDEFKGIVSNGVVDDKAVAKLVDEQPFVGEIVAENLSAVRNFAEAVTVVANGGKHPRAKDVNQFCFDYEKELLKAAPEDQLDHRERRFISRAQYAKLPAEEQDQLDAGTHPELWVLTPSDAINVATQMFTEAAGKRIADVKAKLAKVTGGVPLPKPAAPAKPTPPAPPPQEEKIVRMARPVSPSSVIQVETPTPPPGSEKFISRFLGAKYVGGGTTQR